ncbi:MAG: hypothetical protein R3F39_09305 [Myxococcota bacterium]
MSDDKIDFGPLDPAGEPFRYERMVRTVMAGVEARRGPHPIIVALRSLGRGALLASFATALALWVAAVTIPRQGSVSAGETPQDPVALLTAWSRAGGVPDGVDVLSALEAVDGR